MQRTAFGVLILAATASVTGCGDDTDPYNLLRGVRVLAVQADPPAIAPDESTVLRALVYQPAVATEAVGYHWSWCPFLGPSEEGFPCAIEATELDARLGLLPGTVRYDLGTSETASFHNLLTPQAFERICRPPADAGDLPGSVALPDCGGGLPVSIRLELDTGDGAITALKEITLVAAPLAEPSTNPTLGDIRAVEDPGTESEAKDLPADESRALELGATYNLFVDVPDSASESFTPPPDQLNPRPGPRKESLYVTWFVTEGTTQFERTTFIDGSVGLGVLRSNVWELPLRDDLESSIARLILVVRDERGGIDWTERAVSLVEEVR